MYLGFRKKKRSNHAAKPIVFFRCILSCLDRGPSARREVSGPSLSPTGCKPSGFLDTQICGR